MKVRGTGAKRAIASVGERVDVFGNVRVSTLSAHSSNASHFTQHFSKLAHPLFLSLSLPASSVGPVSTRFLLVAPPVPRLSFRSPVWIQRDPKGWGVVSLAESRRRDSGRKRGVGAREGESYSNVDEIDQTRFDPPSSNMKPKD